MSADSGEWSLTKKNISKNLGEITMIWQCGLKHREIAFKNGVKSWKDPRCNSQTLGFNNSKYGRIVDKIIHINRDATVPILPQIIQQNTGNWKTRTRNEMFVDFETFSDICQSVENIPVQEDFNIIFMIGIGWREHGNWNYTSFICDQINESEEKRIMNNFFNFYQRKGKPSIYHWHAEENIWNKAVKKYRADNLNINNWIDLCDLFRSEPITIKDCFGFGLKEIVKNMRNHGLIDTQMDSECTNGMMAMIKAWNCYANFSNPSRSPIMKDIEKYNEFDCKSLYDIINYIRGNHI